LYSRTEVLSKPCPVPASDGIYGWYFKDPPKIVPVASTHEYDGHRLLYVGIAPKRPTAKGKASTSTLRDRLRQHYNLNAYGSTLRLTLGCLLGLQLRRISSKKHPGTANRMTFGKQGEGRLSEWMDDHALVVWAPYEQAWVLERDLLERLDLPLNLDAHAHGSFHGQLTDLRAKARETARLFRPWMNRNG
jgi:hypothetical protein